MFVAVDSFLRKRQPQSSQKKFDLSLKDMSNLTDLPKQEELDLPKSLKKSQEVSEEGPTNLRNSLNKLRNSGVHIDLDVNSLETEPKNKEDILKMGLQLISSDPEKLSQFLLLGKSFLMLNVPTKG